MRIAMWSGPRNLSTAMMYAFGARADCAVVDEPFYAVYLAQTGLSHPMRSEILAAQSTGPNTVVQQITGSIPENKPVFYQKHMAQHMLPGIDREWMKSFTNVFLIRHPARVVASYAAKREWPNLDDLGFRQQAELYEFSQGLGQNPIVIDSADIRADPMGKLTALCNAIDMDFDRAMLSWPTGGHKDDGIWARHWYPAVHRSTGFAKAEGTIPVVTGDLADLVKLAMPFYQKLLLAKI